MRHQFNERILMVPILEAPDSPKAARMMLERSLEMFDIILVSARAAGGWLDLRLHIPDGLDWTPAIESKIRHRAQTCFEAEA